MAIKLVNRSMVGAIREDPHLWEGILLSDEKTSTTEMSAVRPAREGELRSRLPL